MNKYLITSLLLFIPFISMAADRCTNPAEYTIDRRCYVTDEQKKEKPYKAVATEVLENGRTYCSGTVVKRQGLTRDDVGYFFYTAKHCVDTNHDEITDDTIRIRLPSGKEFNAELVKKGNRDPMDYSTYSGDWAKYRLLTIDQNSKDGVKDALDGEYVKINDSFARGAKNVRVVGYGRLKVMSDQEIENFKNVYADSVGNLADNDIHTEDGGVRGNGVTMFIANNQKVFDDGLLKVSECYQNSNSQLIGCQGWSGNSGGGAYDDNGDLMQIITMGVAQIGGADHASTVVSVDFLPFGRLPNEEK